MSNPAPGTRVVIASGHQPSGPGTVTTCGEWDCWVRMDADDKEYQIPVQWVVVQLRAIPPWQTMTPPTPDQEMCGRLRCLLAEAMDSRAPDYVDVTYPGWTKRVRAILGR